MAFSAQSSHVRSTECRPHRPAPLTGPRSITRPNATQSSHGQGAPALPAPTGLAGPARRRLLLSAASTLLAAGLWPASPSTAATSPSTTAAADALAGSLRQRALEAYSRRDFASAVEALNELVAAAPGEARWLEMRAMALVDGKNFVDATVDFDACLAALGRGPSLDRARVLSGRGLAWEGLGDWVAALDDYTAALAEAAAVGKGADAYIVNARGNCHASLGEWGAARADYLESARLFQTARRQEGSMQMRLDGAVFAFSNAALMLAQLGDDEGALREFRAMERRAPGSADMRAALAALYWGRGEAGRAEEAWEFACDNITVGCAKYRDEDWLRRIRRWPPVMVDRMRSFLALRAPTPAALAAGGGSSSQRAAASAAV